MEVIIYKKDSGNVAVIVPTAEALAQHKIQEIAVKSVPIGTPFKIIDSAELPDAPQEAWGFDEADLTVDLNRIPTPPDWDGLNQAIMGNAEFNQAYATTMQTHPLVAAALPAALTQIASGQTSMFETTFLAMCQIASVTPEQRGIWADIGATFNAPPEFLDIVRGTNG